MPNSKVYIINAPLGVKSLPLHPNKIDYAPLAKRIVGFYTDKYQQAKAIFLWLCKNIAYDTTMRIHDADECYRTKRGVCQAYCELFVHLGKAVGLRVEIIAGDAKNPANNHTERHGWAFVYTTSTQGFLIDPTWGAGSVDASRRFVPNPTPYVWFALNPAWMIFTHFPDDERWQLLPRKVTKQQFLRLPAHHAELEQYGLNGNEVLQKALVGNMALPEIFPTFSKQVALVNIPLDATLEVGKNYIFTIHPQTNAIWGIINGTHRNRVWTKQANGDLTMTFMPRQVGELLLCFNEDGTNRYAVVVRYQVGNKGTRVLPTSPINETKQAVAEITRQFRLPSEETIKQQIKKKFIDPIGDLFK